jgi:hypothetical protein
LASAKVIITPPQPIQYINCTIELPRGSHTSCPVLFFANLRISKHHIRNGEFGRSKEIPSVDIMLLTAMQAQAQKGPPYLPTVAGLGGLPTKSLDDPVCAVFIALYLIGAVTHMAILQVNLRRKKKFIMSGLLFGKSPDSRSITIYITCPVVNSQLELILGANYPCLAPIPLLLKQY